MKKKEEENVIVFPQHVNPGSHYVMMITKHSRAGEPDQQKLKVALGFLNSQLFLIVIQRKFYN